MQKYKKKDDETIINAELFIKFHLNKIKIIMEKGGYLIDDIFIKSFSEELEKHLKYLKGKIEKKEILEFDEKFDIRNIFNIMIKNIKNNNFNYLNKLNFRSLLLSSVNNEYYKQIDFFYKLLLNYDDSKEREQKEILLEETEEEIVNFIVVFALNITLFYKFTGNKIDELKNMLLSLLSQEIYKPPVLNFEPFKYKKPLSPNTLEIFKKHNREILLEQKVKSLGNEKKSSLNKSLPKQNLLEELKNINFEKKILPEEKVKSLENAEKSSLKKSLSNKRAKSLGNEEKSLKSSFKKSFSKQKLLEKILMEKLYRLIYYYNRIKINEDNIYVIYQTFIQTIKELDNYNNEIFKIKNLQDIDNFIDLDLDYNKKNNINYYNYGSETTLLLLLKRDKMDLEKIRKYVKECKKIITETEGIKQKYTINNYLKKIGYDLALALYIFTDYSNQPTYEELKNIIYKILDDIYNNIDNYIDEINKYYDDIMNLKLNSISNTKQTYMKQNILNIFKNSLYKDEPEQLKYNLYRYKYQEFNDKGEPIILWFINDVILRFSDI